MKVENIQETNISLTRLYGLAKDFLQEYNH